jgi:hypothetical protein
MNRKPPLPKGKRMFKLGTDAFSWGFPAELLKLYWKNDRRLVSQLMLCGTAGLIKNAFGRYG